MKEPIVYKKLRKNILIITLVFAILPMLFIGVFIPLQFTDLYYTKIVREVENVAQSKGRTIDIFLEERVAQLRSLASMFTYAELSSSARLTEILRTLQSNSQSYVDLGVIDLAGNHVAYAGAYDIKNVNYKDEPWFAEVQRRGVFISDVFLGFRQFPHIIIAVVRREGDHCWILRATIDSEVFNSIVQSSKLSSGGDAFVVNRNNILQTRSRLAGAIMTELAVEWPAHETRSFQGLLNNKNMLFAKVPLSHASWSLIVAEDPSEHLSLLFKAKVLSFVIIGIGLITLCAATWLTTSFLVGRLEVSDKEKAAFNSSLLQSNKMAALGKLAAGVAHEVNNPLMLILQTAGWIKDLMEDENPQTMKNYADIVASASKIEQHVNRTKDITHRLLGFARRVDPRAESIPLNLIVDQSISFLQSEALYRNITIEKAYSSNGLRVITDVGQLQQVLLNIIDNAIDAVANGGLIIVKTGREDQQAYVKVLDNGPGIPPERLGNIFDPFFTTKNPGEGTGLGLSICYSIMETLGGRIKAQNMPEGGAEFTIWLPLPTV